MINQINFAIGKSQGFTVVNLKNGVFLGDKNEKKD